MNTTPLQILLADDDPDDCLLFKEALDDLALTVQFETVHDGEQLMQQLNKKKDGLPDMLFLDLNMPRKTGNDCLIEIKLCETLKKIPVIIFSTSFVQETVNRLYENGAQYYIRKPNDFSKLKKVIHQAITLVMEKSNLQPSKATFVIAEKANTYSAG